MTVLASKERYFILPLAAKNLNVCVMGKQLQELGKNVYDALYVTENMQILYSEIKTGLQKYLLKYYIPLTVMVL